MMKVEQLLHGYNNGHHLIAGSISLPNEDADKISYLSDWSGYVNPVDGDTSYVTAYPLKRSNLYVVAKSWYANEMSRPGCVWTHSLLINLDNLGQDDDLMLLLKCFRRPVLKGEDYKSYTQSIEISDEKGFSRYETIRGVDSTKLLFLAAGLLDRNKPLVYAIEKENTFYIDFCVRLIQSIPYGILKELSICSGSASMRKPAEGFFNLQFVTGKGESLTGVRSDKESGLVPDKGFRFWLDSIVGGRRDVPQSIHRFSGDIGNSSKRFLAVVNLLKLLNDRIRMTDVDSTLEDVLNYLATAFKEREEGEKVKVSFLSEPVTSLFCEEREFIRLLATTKDSESIDYRKIDFDGRAKALRNEKGKEDYADLLVELSQSSTLNDEGRNLIVGALDGMTVEEIIDFAEKNWYLFKTIATLNSGVLADDFWINMPVSQFTSLFMIFQRSEPKGFISWDKLYNRLLIIDTFVTNSICRAFSIHVEKYVQKALDRWNSQLTMPINNAIMGLCMQQKEEVLCWMGSQAGINSIIRKTIKDNIQPEMTIVKKMGSGVWKSFVREELDSHKDANDLVYIYVLAFNWYDYNALSYIKRVLPFIYEALSTESLSYSSWVKIQKFTGEVPFWRFWDNCQKVLIGVKDYCKAMCLNTREIENFTTNPKLNKELLDLWNK